jgi:hypothetical protein
MNLFRLDKKAEALPFFRRIYAGTDESLKQNATIAVSEYWAAHKDAIKTEQASADFGNMISAYLRLIAAKQAPTPAELYTVGIGAWGVYSTNTLNAAGRVPFMEMALTALGGAAQQGYPNASYYMVQVLRTYKLFNQAVPYEEIFAWTDKAMEDKKSVLPVLELVETMGDTWYKKDLADTSRIVMAYAFNTVIAKMPDSLYLVADRIWKNAQRPLADDQPVSIMNSMFAQLAANSNALPRVRKALPGTCSISICTKAAGNTARTTGIRQG